MTIESNIQELMELKEKLSQLGIFTPSFISKYESVLSAAQTLVNQNAILKVGERAVLIKTPDTENGWKHAKHFLVAGARCVVMSRDYYHEEFKYGCQFEEDSWWDHHNKEYIKTEPDRRLVFMFGQSWLMKESDFIKLGSN